MKQTAVEWLIEQIVNQQKFYIELSKKDKTKRKEIDAILTATTILSMKCGKAKEMEKQQIIEAYYRGIQEQTQRNLFKNPEITTPEQYYNEKYNKNEK
jgi:uncharacterized protein (UPF0335 family)